MNLEERLAFVRAHRTAVFGVNRQHDGPAMSIVYYVMDGNDLLVSTMEARGKAKAVRRNPKVSLCDAVRERMIVERRVQLRLRPYTSFESSQRHVTSPGDVKGLIHDLGQSLPW